jgi:hypothetical protein
MSPVLEKAALHRKHSEKTWSRARNSVAKWQVLLSPAQLRGWKSTHYKAVCETLRGNNMFMAVVWKFIWSYYWTEIRVNSAFISVLHDIYYCWAKTITYLDKRKRNSNKSHYIKGVVKRNGENSHQVISVFCSSVYRCQVLSLRNCRKVRHCRNRLTLWLKIINSRDTLLGTKWCIVLITTLINSTKSTSFIPSI